MKTIFIIQQENDIIYKCDGLEGLFQDLDKFIDNLVNVGNIVFDLTGMTYVNSLMIGKLIKYSKVLKTNGVEMKAEARTPVFVVLKNASIGQIFEIQEVR